MIKQITIRNFKSIGEVTVYLDPVTVLVGRSGTGKSNFLMAIRFLRDYLLAPDKAVGAQGDWHHIQPAGGVTALPEIQITFDLPDYAESFQYTLAFTQIVQRTVHVKSEKLQFGDRVIFEWGYATDARNHNAAWISKPSVSSLPSLNQQPILGKLPTITEAVLAYTALTTGIGWYDFPALVLTDKSKQNAKPSIFGDANSVGEFSGFYDGGNNYLSVYQQLTRDMRTQKDRRAIINRVKQLNSSVSSLELDSITQPKKMVVGHQLGDETISLDLSQESDGFRRFLAHLLALYQKPPRLALMFEEPENGIFPGALEVLAEEIKRAPGEGRGQVLLTTHSPGLLDHFKETSIRVVHMDPETQRTQINPLDQEQREAIQESLLTPGELLTVDEARPELPNSTKGAPGA